MLDTFQMIFVVVEVRGEKLNKTRWAFRSSSHRRDHMVGESTDMDSGPCIIIGPIGGLAEELPDTGDDISCVGAVRSSIIQVPLYFLGNSGGLCRHVDLEQK